MVNGPAPSRRAAVVALSDARARVLEFLQAQAEPVGTAHVASVLGLHDNTARLHLDGLVASGLATRVTAQPKGRGRPAMLFSSGLAQELDPRVRDYAHLAAALATVVAQRSADPAGDARAAGQRWGEEMVAGKRPRSAIAARTEVVAILDDLGFDPQADARVRSVALRRCPLLDVAREHPEVVCQVHLGLVSGALQRMGREDPQVELLPFAEPGACRLHLR